MSNPNEQLDPADIFSMSEDELSKFDPASYQEAAPALEPEETQEPEPEEQPEEIEVVDENPEVVEEADTDPANPVEPGTPDPAAKPDPKSDPAAPNYQELYEQIIGKPFKANGKDLNVKTPEEAIQLMQMGANYHEKMAALKPVRRQARMLQDAGIKSDEEIAFLLDLHKKDPTAIAKLVKDSNINLYEFDIEQSANYKANPQTVTDEQLNLEDTYKSLEAAPGFQEMYQTVSTTWDDQSQGIIVKAPGILNVLQAQKASGEFDLIMQEVNRVRMFNPASASVPTIQLYRDAEVALRQANSGAAIAQPQVQQPAAPLSQLQKPVEDPAASRRAAAATPRNTPAQQKRKLTPEDIFSLSDEEFAKIDPRKFN